MRRTSLTVLALAFVAASAPLAAQTPNPACAAASQQTEDACEKAVDIYNYMMPQLGTSLVGGSHTLGMGSTLGGLGHFAIALRGNAILNGTLPDVDNMTINTGGRQSESLTTKNQILGLPGIDFAIGVYKGFPIGVTRIGSVDAIGNIIYIPEIEGDGSTITPTDGKMKIGFGARVGLLEQSLVVPGVSFSYMKRDIPTLDFVAVTGDDEFAIREFTVKTTSWRLAAQKSLMLFQFGLGVGQDKYDASTDITVTVNDIVTSTFTASPELSMTRTTMYANVGFNLFLAKFVAEIGQVSGGDVNTYNTFDKAADKSRMYGSAGIRISF